MRGVLLLFILVGFSYALVTPPFEASDELWHYPMIQHLGNGNPLPVQVYDPDLAGPWKQEASQPPLYYYLGAVLTFWVDTSDMGLVRQLNPHVNNGEITADGNINLAVHNNPDLNPWRGTLLAVRIVRLFSVLLGAATLYLTYLIGKSAVPDRPEIPLLAAIFAGFTPMFLFISGAVNNDNLAVPLASLGLFQMIRLIRQEAEPSESRILWLNRSQLIQVLLIGVVIGAAVLTKQGTIGLLPLAWGTFFILAWLGIRNEFEKPESDLGESIQLLITALARSLIWFVIMFLPVLLIAGWWYARNVQLYGDLLGWSAFEAVLGVRETPAPLAQLWDERWGFMLSYWGLFGGVNVPMSTWVYYALNVILVLAIPGGLGYAASVFSDLWQREGATFRKNRSFKTGISGILNGVVTYFPLVVCVLFSIAIVYALAQWARNTWSSQGRLVFTAMSSLNILFALGLVYWLRREWARIVAAVLGGGMILLGALSPWLFIWPAYAEPPLQSTLSCDPDSSCHDHDGLLYSDFIQLNQSQFFTDALQPGDHFDLMLEWETVDASDRNWSVFVHLVDPVIGRPIAQRDMYLGQGLLASEYLPKNSRLVNRYRLFIPETAVAPADLELVVGLYDQSDPNGERLRLPNGNDHVQLGTIQLLDGGGEVPNQSSVKFEDKFELVGFDISPRLARAGETVVATFYWVALEPQGIDYTFYAQVTDPDTTRWAALDLGQPTSTWQVGDIQALQYELVLRDDTPPGTYPVRLGIYSQQDGNFVNLQRVTSDGRLTDDFVNLTPIRVE